MKKQYDCVFSLGEACLCATILSKLGLRHFSSPFDWMYGATFEERVNILLNDFENFLNKEDLSFVGQRDNPEPCDIYFNNRTKICFNHDFPLNIPLEKSFSNIKKKYNRRISRLFDTIKKSKNVLIVFMELPDSDKKASIDTLKDLMKKINNKFSDTKIDILYIKHNEDMADGIFYSEIINDNITIGYCFNRDKNASVNYTGNFNNVKMLFSEIKSDAPLWDNLKHSLSKYKHKLIRIFYRKRIKNGNTYIRFCGIKLKTFAEYKNNMLKKMFFILDFCLPKKNNNFAFTVGCVGKNKFYDNSRAVFEHIKKDKSKRKYVFYINNCNLDIDNAQNTQIVKLYSFKGMCCLARCKNIFVMHSFLFDFSDKLGSPAPNLIWKYHNVVQLWHGIPIKKICNTIYNYCPEHKQEFMKYKFLVTSSANDSYAMCAAFSPIDYNNICITGLPRNDFLVMAEERLPEYLKKQLAQINDVTKDKMFILYAPTWRGGEGAIGLYDFSDQEIESLKSFLLKNNAVMGVRLHPFLNAGTEERVLRLIDNELIIDVGSQKFSEMQMLVRRCDICITDYSSAYIDAMYLDKPVFCFCYDYDNYKDVEKGFLYDLDSVFPSQKQTSFVELLKYIQSEIDSGTQTQSLSYQQIKKFFFQYTDGDNCKRIISLIEH